ncbi:MAG: archease, partial [Candidatus Hadarchaeales archaeon]
MEHPSDIGFRAYGSNLAEAFENAAVALFEIMTDTRGVEPKEEVEVELKAEDRGALLYDWLDHLIYLQDSRGLLFSKFKVEIAEKAGELELRAKAWGE